MEIGGRESRRSQVGRYPRAPIVSTRREPERVLGPGSYIVQPGGVTHGKLNAGAGTSLLIVYFDGPVDFVPAK